MEILFKNKASRFTVLRNVCIIIFFTASLFIGNALLSSSAAEAACDPPFEQVNENGFGRRLNLYSWAMYPFTSASGSHLYVSTYAKWIGAQIWRYDGNDWERVVRGGLGSRNNEGVRIMMEYKGALYAGSWNRTNGAQIWRTFNGTTWEVVVSEGFDGSGNESIRSLREFNGYLYAGAHNPDGYGQVWRTINGTDWEPVNLIGFGDLTNNSVHDLQVFNGYLYAATRNEEKGAQIWRSLDGINFEVVVGDGAATPSGFGDPNTAAILHMEVFNGYMYIGNLNFDRGFDMQRTNDGINYEKVGQDGFGYGSCAGYAWRFNVFDGYLWMAGLNTCDGGTVWRTSDGTNWEQIVGDVGLVPGGFGDVSNWGNRSIGVYNNKIYIGTAECFFNDCFPDWDGTEVWEWQGECDQ